MSATVFTHATVVTMDGARRILEDAAVRVAGDRIAEVCPTAEATIAPGDFLAVRCDGCPPDLSATISYIADGPEFTPPVIYSVDSRQKLVYLVEAKPADGSSLKPGQIVDVDLPGVEK